MYNLFPYSNRKRMTIPFSFILIMFLSSLSFAQLNGTYTIGPSSGTYATFTEAMADLNLQGVSGPVIFEAEDGAYNEQFEIGIITGVSETNTVTIRSASGDSSTVIVYYEDSNVTDNYVIKLNSAEYVHFENLTLLSVAPAYNRIIHFEGQITDFTLQHCAVIGVANMSGDSHSLLYARNALMDATTIRHNRFENGAYSIDFNLDPEGTNTVIHNNYFLNTYGAVSFIGQRAPVISNNHVENASRRGFDLSWCGGEVEITGNYVDVVDNYALNMFTCYGGAPPLNDPGLIANNFFISRGGTYCQGIRLFSCTYFDIHHNSVNVLGTDQTYTAGLFISGGNNLNVLNNNLACENNGYGYYTSSVAAVEISDYNNIYSPANNLAYWGENVTDLDSLVAVSGMETHSVSVYPHYQSDVDLHTTAPWLNGRGTMIAAIETDIDGDARTDPDIGADEFTPTAGTETPLAGTYTIGLNPYQTFQAAVTDLVLRGVSGPVIFEAVNNTYNAQIEIRSIPGADETNTVTFRSQGQDAGYVTLYHAANGTEDNYVVRLKGAGFLNLQFLTLRASSSNVAHYGRVVDIIGGVHDLVISDCQLLGSPVVNSADNALSVVYARVSNGVKRSLLRNIIRDGSYGIDMTGFNYNSPSAGPVISGNMLYNQQNAIHLVNQLAPALESNTIWDARSGGVHLERCDSELRFTGNRLDVWHGYALTLQSCNGGLPPLEVPGLTANNFIHIGDENAAEGIRLYSSTYQNIYHNSVHITSTDQSYGRAFTNTSGNEISVMNNIFANSGGGYTFYMYSTPTNFEHDFNDYFTTGPALAYLNGDITNLGQLQTTGGMDSHSLSVDPGFLSDVDLHVTEAALDSSGRHLTEVITDIDGEDRDAQFPDIGADEFGSEGGDVPFTEVPAGLDGAAWGNTAWGDYDNDGDLDLLITGSKSGSAAVYLYENDQGTFNRVEHSIEALEAGCAAWADFSGDNRLDVLVSGTDAQGESHTRLYMNNGAGDFIVLASGLIGVTNSSVDWGDYDNDGDQDLLLAGYQGGQLGNIIRIYRNEGSGIFTEVNPGMAGIPNCIAQWADFNRDGRLDVFLFGEAAFRIYQNQGDDIFYNLNIPLGGLSLAAADCGDFDNDGDPDIVVSGSAGAHTYVTKLFRNDGNNNFSDRTLAGLPGMAAGDLKWGDYDNDGYPDLFMIGATDSTIEAALYRNNQNSTFSRADMSFTGMMDGSISWGDYNNDEKLDIVYSGRDAQLQSITKLYMNHAAAGNNAPSVPGGILQSVSSDFAVLEWSPSSDDETPQNGLTYNIRMGASSGATNTATPMSTDGYLFLPKDGNRGSSTRIFVENLMPNTTYYWSVQAVDKGYRASDFSGEHSFQTQPAAEGPFIEHPVSFVGMTSGDLLWAKFFVTVHEQIVQSGWMGNVHGTKTRMYDKVDGFYEEYDAGLLNLDQSALDVGDFDNDGDLDLINTGKQFGGVPLTVLYEVESDFPNSLGAHFTPVQTLLPDVYDGDVAFGDFDNDGDLDLVLTGKTAADSVISVIYKNDDPDILGRYFDHSGIDLPGVFNSAVAWIDYDVDGDNDLILSGETAGGEVITALYENENGSFSESGTAFTPLKNGSVTWADYNNDGFPDILICGQDDADVPHTIIYKNTNGQFTNSQISLVGVHSGNAVFVDYDGDGDYDIALTGITATGENVTRFYNGQGDDTFGINNQTGIADAGGGAIAWGNADFDNKIDVAVSGFDGSDRVMKIYHNNSVNENTHPAPPSGLTAVVISSDEIEFHWQPGSDQETPAAGLTYNLRVGTTSGGNEIMAASTDVMERGASREGNVGHNRTWRIKGLEQNDYYYWSVQTVDNGFLASEFASGLIYMSSVFTQETNFTISDAVTNGELQWMDMNNDGRLDIFVTGRSANDVWLRRILRNNGDGSFDEIPPLGPGFLAAPEWGDIDFGDLDGDGDIDFVMSGRIVGNRQTNVYRNDGNLEFLHYTNFSGLAYSSVRLGDMDNNGTLDVLLIGDGGDAAFQRDERFYYYKNHGDLNFEREFDKDGLKYGSLAIGDYDGDSDNDIAMLGLYGDGNDAEYRTRILRQIRTQGKFDNITAGFPGIAYGQCDWIDIDNDGDLDFFYSGRIYDNTIATFFSRNVSGTFPLQPRLFPSYTNTVADFGDYDNDGDMDMIICGRTTDDEGEYCLYENTNGEFERTGFALAGVFGGAAAFGDYDNDGDLDIVVSGFHKDNQENRYPFCYLYRNNLGRQNDNPTAPANLSSQVGTSSIVLSWNPGEDDITPSSTLTYNLKVGTYPRGDDIMPSNSRLTGERLMAESGNVNHALRWILIDLKPGKYYWTVQTVDQSFKASPFAPVDSFEIPELTFYPEITSVTDVPHDQGGKVQIHWLATRFDTNPDSVPYYSIWRALPDGSARPEGDLTLPTDKRMTKQTGFPEGMAESGNLYWEWLADQPARQFVHYAYTAETLYDSSSRSDGIHHFMVIAHFTEYPNDTYPSNIYSGYSVDNISPAAPENLYGMLNAGAVILSWNPNTENDLCQYLIYRSALGEINPASDTLYAVTSDTIFVDANPLSGVTNYYVVCAQDIHDNISIPSEEVSVMVTGITRNGAEVPDQFRLYQCYPNPFNPWTTIAFDLPENANVRLNVYNMLGEAIATLVDHALPAGRYKFRWEPQNLSSGLYIYVIQTGDFQSKRKMILVK